MKSLLILVVLFFGLPTFAAHLDPVEMPNSTKVAAAVRAWEKFYTPDLCYPNAVSYSIVLTDTTQVDEVILDAAKKTSKDVKFLTELKKQMSVAAVKKVANIVVSDLGLKKDQSFVDKMVRIYEKVNAREVYYAQVTNGETKYLLEGSMLAIIDRENMELTLLTLGDTFEPSACE